jgi:hypothetical protein
LDSQATSMNALSQKLVNEIMRRICCAKRLSLPSGRKSRNVAATQAVCGLISGEVAIYA